MSQKLSAKLQGTTIRWLQVERLAAGLRHERSFVAAALDTSSRDAAAFATQMLAVNTVPAVLLYPEAARGCLRFLGEVHVVLHGLHTLACAGRVMLIPARLLQ